MGRFADPNLTQRDEPSRPSNSRAQDLSRSCRHPSMPQTNTELDHRLGNV